jgi:predicted enzyme related to lactoylglutathione lyase
MPNPVVHFEIYADDPSKLSDFYKGLFDWKIDKAPEMDYWMIHTVPTDAKGMPAQPGGLNGGMMKRPMPDARAWLNYVSVVSVDETVKKARSAGAQVMRPKSPVPKMGWFAILTDPEMNVFAIWQNDPNAG